MLLLKDIVKCDMNPDMKRGSFYVSDKVIVQILSEFDGGYLYRHDRDYYFLNNDDRGLVDLVKELQDVPPRYSATVCYVPSKQSPDNPSIDFIE